MFTFALFLAYTSHIAADDGADLESGDDYEGADYDDYGGGGYGGGGYGDYGGYGGYGGYGDDYGGGADLGPAFSTIDDFEGVEKFLMEDHTEPAVIGFFNEDTNKDDIEVFEEVASAHRSNFRFAYSIEDDVREKMKYKTGCTVVVFAPPRFVSEKYDKPKSRYPSKSLNADTLAKFIMKKSLPLVGQKTWKSSERYDSAKLPVVTLFTQVDLEKNPKGFDYYSNRLRRVAQDFIGKLVFNVGDKEDFSYQLEDYDIELPNKKDVGVGIKDGDRYYAMTESFSVDNLRSFCSQVLAGEITPKIKEEPDYSSSSYDEDSADVDEDSSVVKVTDDNFDEIVQDPGKDVLIEFYAPWCGHCKSLKPVLADLAEDLSSVTSVTIGAMDATANDPPSNFNVEGYPTLYFVPANAKDSPISYDGSRDKASMKEFIKSHASISINDEL